MNNSKRWSESELLQVLKLYYAMKKDGLTVSGEASQIEALASSMGRSFAAVSMRLANYKSLDTDEKGYPMGDSTFVTFGKRIENVKVRRHL